MRNTDNVFKVHIRKEIKKIKKNRIWRPLVWWVVGFISALAILLGLIVWMAGVVYSELPSQVNIDQSYKGADVIVCLAGGKGRIRRALELYEKGYGKVLYISGTDPQASVGEILKELRWVGPIDSSKIVLENISSNTIENAQEVKKYLHSYHYKSILLVTSIYHVRRAHYIFQKILPRDTRLDVSWFEQEPFLESDWWKRWTGITVTVTEFFKFFYAYLQLLF